jgi:hypothetical protein
MRSQDRIAAITAAVPPTIPNRSRKFRRVHTSDRSSLLVIWSLHFRNYHEGSKITKFVLL